MFRKDKYMNNVLLKMQTTQTENGALSYATSGSACLDYWSKCGTLAGRSQDLVNADMERIFAEDENTALRIVFGMRLITRKPDSEEVGEDIATGYGRRDEFYKAVVWMHSNRKKMLYRNLHLIPMFGSWKDFLNEPLISVLDRGEVFSVVRSKTDCFETGFKFPSLLCKYLPQIRSENNIRSDRDRKRVVWAKDFCKFWELNPKEYRQLKSGGIAHIWQKQMGRKEWDKIAFSGIPGKAMLLHTSQTGKDNKTVFERHDQVPRMIDWLKTQKTVKFTGYPYELYQAAKKTSGLMQRMTFDRQFETILETMKNHSLGNVLACLDTSGSMSWENAKVKDGVYALDICLSMGLVFSALNVGEFKDSVVSFATTSQVHKLSGTFCERVAQIEHCGGMGSTNFQSVIDMLVRIRKSNPNIPISEYPETLIIVSDMQFNPANGGNSMTNYEEAMYQLRQVGLNDVRIIWWQVNGRTSDFPAQMNDKGVYMIGGFDPTNIKALMGLTSVGEGSNFNVKEKKDQTPEDGMKNFLSQPIFQLIQ